MAKEDLTCNQCGAVLSRLESEPDTYICLHCGNKQVIVPEQIKNYNVNITNNYYSNDNSNHHQPINTTHITNKNGFNYPANFIKIRDYHQLITYVIFTTIIGLMAAMTAISIGFLRETSPTLLTVLIIAAFTAFFCIIATLIFLILFSTFKQEIEFIFKFDSISMEELLDNYPTAIDSLTNLYQRLIKYIKSGYLPGYEISNGVVQRVQSKSQN